MLALALALTLALPAAAGFTDGYAEGAFVGGPRPAAEVRRALALARPALDACLAGANNDASDAPLVELFIDLEILAAGFVDRAAVFAGTAADEACVTRALRTLRLGDRGVEPRTHAVVHLVAGGALPRPTPRDVGEALVPLRDDLARCADVARRADPSLAGSVIVRLRVADERARVEVIGGSLRDEPLRACVVRVLTDVRIEDARAPADVAWPLFFARPPPPPPAQRPRSAWEAPTLFEFLGCGAAFHT